MRLARVFRGRPPPDEVPLGHIADEVEAVTTARLTADVLVSRGDGRTLPVRHEGFWDYRHHLGFIRISTGEVIAHHLHAGPDVLCRLTPEEQQRTGMTWRWESPADPGWENHRAETVAAIRHRAVPVAATVEEHDGERLRRFSLRIRPRRHETDPLLAGLYQRCERHGIKKLTYDVWLTADGRLRRTCEGVTILRSHARPGSIASITETQWDFGVVVEDLVAPRPHEIIRPRVEPGLTVLIDGRVSPY
ncbi:hypothetical protein ACRYCC_09180 [Actinomadura scrupuli]|uniref:hypothetical protein n=1 Tax=Actinomadura scrupuli TaxID=559629 RepID=UPI003D95B036